MAKNSDFATVAAVVAPSSKSLSGLIEEPRRPDDQAPSGGRAIPAGTEVEEKSIRAAETQEKRTTADKQHRQNDYLTSWPLTIVISSLALSTMLIALDTSIIGVATPTISTVFQSLNDIAWYGSAYLLTVTAFQPSFGNLYKFFDIKMTFMISLVIFEIGSIVCAAAPSSLLFILGRAIAGLGAAGGFQGALSIITHTVELERRPLFMGIVISVFGIAVSIGPVIGGVLTDRVNWRWCFWINVPVGFVVLVVLSLFLKINNADTASKALPLKTKIQRIDTLGTILFIGSICCLLLALQWGGQTLPWSSATVIGLLVGCGLLMIGFGILQWKRGETATIPPRILRKQSVCAGSCFLFFLAMPTFVFSFYIPLFFQAAQGVSATASGVQLIALIVPQMFAVVVIGAIITKWGVYVPYMILGIFICIVGSGLLIRLEINTTTTIWASFLVITGLGLGLCMNIPYIALQVILSKDDLPTANGESPPPPSKPKIKSQPAIAVFAWQLGGALALSISQNLFLNALLSSLRTSTLTLPPSAVLAAGASGLRSVARTAEILLALREMYAEATTRPLIYALAAACVAMPFACAMEWKNVRVVAGERKGGRSEGDGGRSEMV